jgi:TRAP-type C4-dicarboxylate transport system permease small subunit
VTRLLRAIDLACAAGAGLAAIAAGLLALLLIAEVVLTSFFATSQPYVIEYAIFLQAAVLFAGSGWALRQGAHIRVSVLLAALPEAAISAAGPSTQCRRRSGYRRGS